MTTEVAEQTANWSEWRSQVPETIRGDASLKDVKDIGSLADQFINAQKLIGSSIRIPKDGADPKEIDSFHAKLGRPNSPNDYQFKPEGLPEGYKYNESLEKSLRPVLHKLGVSGATFQGIMKAITEADLGKHNSSQQEVAMRREESISQLKREFGNDFESKVGAAQTAVRKLGGQDLLDALKESGYGDDPRMVRAFAKVGEYIPEDKLVSGGGSEQSSKEAIQAKIDAIYMDKNHPYNNDKAPSTARQSAMKEMGQLFKQLSEAEAA